MKITTAIFERGRENNYEHADRFYRYTRRTSLNAYRFFGLSDLWLETIKVTNNKEEKHYILDRTIASNPSQRYDSAIVDFAVDNGARYGGSITTDCELSPQDDIP